MPKLNPGTKETGLSEMKLPKVSVPTLVGKVLNWKNFWKQFDANIHSKTGLSDTAKLMYLQDALKDGPARFFIRELIERAIRSVTVSPGRTHLQYPGCGSSARTAATRSFAVCIMLRHSTIDR